MAPSQKHSTLTCSDLGLTTTVQVSGAECENSAADGGLPGGAAIAGQHPRPPPHHGPGARGADD